VAWSHETEAGAKGRQALPYMPLAEVLTMSAQFEIHPLLRPMRPEDVPRVMAIEREIYPYPWTEGIFLDCLRVGYGCWVLERTGELTGYGVVTLAAGEAHLLNLSVSSQHQGQGLGRVLLRHLIDFVQRLGGTIVLLEVRPSNRAAIHLYVSEGFARIGTRHRYYPSGDGREDAWVFSKSVAE
jgi:ribosomal-protein-alanine N-acetyltransferase